MFFSNGFYGKIKLGGGVMIRIGICDDDVGARDALRLAVERLLREEEEPAIYEFSSGEGVIGWLKNHSGELDVLFLDVELSGISGMEAAQRIREKDSGLMIVFVTGYSDFVFDGYSVGAVDYLVKPVNKNKLEQTLTRVKKVLSDRNPQTFVIKNADGMYRILKKDILYLSSDKRLVRVTTRQREYVYYGKLDEAQTALGPGFVRIHRRYLVRAGAVSKIEGNHVAIGDFELPVSRALRGSVMMALARDMIGEKN